MLSSASYLLFLINPAVGQSASGLLFMLQNLACRRRSRIPHILFQPVAIVSETIYTSPIRIGVRGKVMKQLLCALACFAAFLPLHSVQAALDSTEVAVQKTLTIIRVTPDGEDVPAGKQVVIQFNR